MALAFNDGIVSYTGNGSNLNFNIDFPYYAQADIKVKVAGVSKVLGSNFTISNGSVKDGYFLNGVLSFLAGQAPANGASVIIQCETPARQDLEFEGVSTFNTGEIEQVMDRLTMTVRDAKTKIDTVAQDSIDAAVNAAEAAIADEVTAAANSATSAATSATNASNSASNAATSATNASNSATNASNSASNAATSATNAANSATAAQQIVDALDDLTAGAYLAYELRTANFTSVAGGRYFIDTSGLTLGTGITVSLFATPSVLTECVFTTNATDDRSIEFSNTPYPIEGYESSPLTVTKTCHIHLKFNPVNNKWIWINEYSSNERTRIITSDLVTGTADEVRPGDLLKVDTTSGVINIDAPIGTKYPRPGDTFTIEDYKGKFDQNNCIVDFNGKKLEGVVRNLVSMDLRGVSSTFEYLNDTTGWSRKSSMGGKR